MVRVDWKPVFVLPNIRIEAAIEGAHIALAPVHDHRVEEVGQQQPRFREFLTRFSDAFGVPVDPAVMLVRSPERTFDIAVLAGFRDLVAHSVIAYARARVLAYSRQGVVLFGNSFSFYPWMTDKNDEHLIAKTPALLALHDVGEFHGQSVPEVPTLRIGTSDVDAPLFEGLLKRWSRWSGSATPASEDVALFRSLNMALHASMLPGGIDATFYDQGRLIALWVSAFEILVHPGANGKADLFKVFDLLERVPWERRGCKDRTYPTRVKGKKHEKEDRTLGSWLYERLYDTRSNFLHGNPVTADSLRVGDSGRWIFEYAAPLYRLALTALLPLELGVPQPPLSDVAASAAYLDAQISFMGWHRPFEDALLTSRSPSPPRGLE